MENIDIVVPVAEYQYDQIRKLMRAFINWHRQRHVEDISLIDDYFKNKDFEEELASLPAKYAVGRNILLLALYKGQPAGCVALREIDTATCEMKRMFVYEQYHGCGIGKALAKEIITKAREAGYSSMKLDTSIRQVEAQTLYQRCGFKRIEPYYDLPKRLQEWLVFMELKL